MSPVYERILPSPMGHASARTLVGAGNLEDGQIIRTREWPGSGGEGAVMKISHNRYEAATQLGNRATFRTCSRRLRSARRDRGWIEFPIVYRSASLKR